MLSIDTFELLTDNLGQHKSTLETAISNVKTNLDADKSAIGSLDDFEDTALLVPAMSQSYDRLITSRLEYGALTPLAQAIFDAVSGLSFLNDNDVRVSDDYADIMSYLGRAIDAKYILPPVTEIVTLDFTGDGTFTETGYQEIDTTSYGKAFLEVKVPADIASATDIVLTINCKRIDDVIIEETVTIPSGTLTDATFAIGNHSDKNDMYIGYNSISATGGANGDQLIIQSVDERIL